MNQPKSRTPGPWKACIQGSTVWINDAKGDAVIFWTGFDRCEIPDAVHKANATYIVEAVNGYEALRAQLATLTAERDKWQCEFGGAVTDYENSARELTAIKASHAELRESAQGFFDVSDKCTNGCAANDMTCATNRLQAALAAKLSSAE